MVGRTLPLGGLLLLFVASRLLYVVLVDPAYLVHYGGEELYRGTIAHELVTGLKQPFTDYRADNYSGGSLVIGIVAAAFFLLFGSTVFALKLAPLLLFTLALVIWYWTVRRAAGERVAQVVALMFCVSPPQFTAYSVTAMGFHSESIVFTALTMLLLFKMLSDEDGSVASPALLGLTAGFGLWFTYVYGLTLLATLLFWVWHDRKMFRRWRTLWFALGFLAGFSPWIVMNLQMHFGGLVVRGLSVWDNFSLAYLLDGLTHPRKLAPYEFFANFASEDSRGLYRRAVNLAYALLFLGPILTAEVVRLKRDRSSPAGPGPARVGLETVGILYVVVFALAVQFSDFREGRYYLPAHPILFFLGALSLARCQEMFPRVQRRIQTVFLGSMVVLGVGAHVPLLSLDRPGYAFSAKGYSYAMMPVTYFDSHIPAGAGDSEFIVELVQRPFLSSIVPRLSLDDQRQLSRAIALMLADAVPLNGKGVDFVQIERLVPAGFANHFYYQLGVMAMGRYPNELPEALAAVEFLRHRSAASHRLALAGIYRLWPRQAALDGTYEPPADSPAAVAREVAPYHWRALGHLAGWSWLDRDRSLTLLNAYLQSFVPRLEPSVQRYFLQGVGQVLFTYPTTVHWVPPTTLERFPHAYHHDLFVGWGMALGEDEFYSPLPWKGPDNPLWTAWTRGLSARSVLSIQEGKAHFEALFERAASNHRRT